MNTYCEHPTRPINIYFLRTMPTKGIKRTDRLSPFRRWREQGANHSSFTMAPSPPSSTLACATVTVTSAAVLLLLLHYRSRRSKDTTSSTNSNEDSDTTATTMKNSVDNELLVVVSARGDIMETTTADVDDDDDDDLVGETITIKSLNDNTNTEEGEEQAQQRRILSRGTITIVYASTTGTCASFATRLHQRLLQFITSSSSRKISGGISVRVMKVNDIDWFDELTNDYDGDAGGDIPPILLFILPTWTNGTLPPDSDTLLPSLHDICSDWRIAPEPLRTADNNTVRVGVFGMGSSAYDKSTMGKPAKETFALLVSKLGARPLVSQKSIGRNATTGGKIKSLVIGDSESGDCDGVFDSWMEGVVTSIFPSSSTTVAATAGAGRKNNRVSNKVGKAKKDEDEITVRGGGCCNNNNTGDTSSKETEGEGCACKSNTSPTDDNDKAVVAGCCSSNIAKNDAVDLNKDDDDDYDATTDPPSEDDDDDNDDDDDSEGGDIVDLEDMGDVIKKQSTSMKSKEPQEMVTPKQAKALKKEGYRLIGTHSAVKLCRWTKHQLRGRGGCYKHTHYGITSYQCMEATPSLACANKCVFCWRHHKNPVGKEWRWKTDDPYMIVDEAVKEHISMIKETRGIPGIQLDRWHEAHTVRHCALSLVGEPIMYPQINALLGELHARKISTFLVTNGQHPQAIEDLIPITQLYVSVDASTPESLEAIDRPLFNDAWERLKSSLTCLKRKGQRTVARLTVVKGWNSDDIGGYARLIALGHCSLVEVKGVTFCGKSDASNLNMTNTPWHHEVVEFSRLLLEEMKAVSAEGGDDPLPEYDLACEHKHSCSVLLARVDQFAVPDPDDPSKRKWRTWIDYDKFQLLVTKRNVDPTFSFGVEDYVADTPSWALFGADEEGFDPTDNRHRKKSKHPKYAKFDKLGIPTHDTFNEPLSMDEISKLKGLMELKKIQLGDATTVTELHGGEKVIDDASLMFRGLVVIR